MGRFLLRTDWLLRVFALGALLLATLWVVQPYVRAWLFAETEPKAIVARGELAEYERNTVEVFSARSPAVALVVTQRTDRDPFGRDIVGTGAGSGFVWDAAGHIVTNDHVVAGAQAIGVRLDADRTVPAELVGTAPDYDLAVLRPLGPLEPAAPIPVGSSHDLVVGQTVYAIGNPFGLSRSMSVGIISALDRHLPAASGREIRDVIQTDAAIPRALGRASATRRRRELARANFLSLLATLPGHFPSDAALSPRSPFLSPCGSFLSSRGLTAGVHAGAGARRCRHHHGYRGRAAL